MGSHPTQLSPGPPGRCREGRACSRPPRRGRGGHFPEEPCAAQHILLGVYSAQSFPGNPAPLTAVNVRRLWGRACVPQIDGGRGCPSLGEEGAAPESVAGIPKGESPQSNASRSLFLSKPPCAQIPSFPSEVTTEAALRLHK